MLLLVVSPILRGNSQPGDLRETTRLAIEAYESSLESLQFQVEVVSAIRPTETIEAWVKGDSTVADQSFFYAEDSHGRRAWDLKAYESGGTLVFRDSAYHDGNQGYRIEYDDSNPQLMQSVTIDRFWAGDAGQASLPYPLAFTRWSVRQQAWKPYSSLLSQDKTKSYENRLVIEDTSPRRTTTLYPDPLHSFLPNRVTIEFESGGSQESTVEEFAFVNGRSFPIRGKVQRANPTGESESNYTNLWKVTGLEVNRPIPIETFTPAITQDGVIVRNKITGESYTTGPKRRSGSTSKQPKPRESPVERNDARAAPHYWSPLTVLAYGVGTISLTTIVLIILSRLGVFTGGSEKT